MALDVERIRKDFPILQREARGKPLVYLDNAATTQKPRQVVDAVSDFYLHHNANVHRSIHQLGEEATGMYEAAHARVGEFVGAAADEVVFTKNCTEAINLVAYAWARRRLEPGDEVVITEMEHHSNLVPWQQAARETGARLRYAPLTKDGRLDLDACQELLGPRTRLVAATHMSNVLGTVTPARELTEMAHDHGARVLLDAAQSVPHLPVDVRDIGCDFLAFSGHKMLGPTGIGVLCGKRDVLDAMDPFLFGGEMIRKVTFDATTWNDLPWKFEAGTPNIAQAVGLAAAADYLAGVGMDNVREHERALTERALQRLDEVGGVTVYGPGLAHRGGVVSFNVDGVHAHDVATLLDAEGVAIRAGHHCAQPLMGRLGVPSTARASFTLYNTPGEVDALAQAITKTKEVFGL